MTEIPSLTRLRLQKVDKLTKSAEFERIMKGGAKRLSSPTFLLLVKPNSLATSRLGIIVGKKAYRKATQRNRLKRLIRESFRLKAKFLPGLDIIVLAKKGQHFPTNQQVFRQLEQLWGDLHKKFVSRSCG